MKARQAESNRTSVPQLGHVVAHSTMYRRYCTVRHRHQHRIAPIRCAPACAKCQEIRTLAVLTTDLAATAGFVITSSGLLVRHRATIIVAALCERRRPAMHTSQHATAH